MARGRLHLVPFSDDELLIRAAEIQYERDRQELRQIVLDLYGSNAAHVCPRNGEDDNPENVYAMYDYANVYDKENNLLLPDFSLSFWQQYQQKIADLIEQDGQPDTWNFTCEGARCVDESAEWLRKTLQDEFDARISQPWYDLAGHYDLTQEPQDVSLPLYQLVPNN